MRIAWVHPSWRDLVIEKVARDDAARRHFLRSCGIDGALLALSSAGGRDGERDLPLLRDDADWDALTERLHRLVPELTEDEVGALLHALADAPAHATGPHQRVEAEALGTHALRLVARRWEGHSLGVRVELLSAWFELADKVPAGSEPPRCEPSLLMTAPTLDLDLTRVEDCERLDDWLWLAEVARHRRPADLARAGFPDRYRPELTALLRAAERAYLDRPGMGERIDRILRRLDRLEVSIPGVRSAPPPVRVPAKTVASRVPPVASAAGSSLVERVLRDL